MKNNRILNIISRILTVIAILLLVSSVLSVVWIEVNRNEKVGATDKVLTKLDEIIGNPIVCIVDDDDDREIPYYSLDGTDYCGVLYSFGTDRKYPITSTNSDNLSSTSAYVLSGTPYNGSLVILGSSTERCFDFADSVDIGDSFLFTDMLGNQFAYKVTSVKHISSTEEFTDDSENDCALIIDKFADKYVLIKMKSAMTE